MESIPTSFLNLLLFLLLLVLFWLYDIFGDTFGKLINCINTGSYWGYTAETQYHREYVFVMVGLQVFRNI